MKVELIVSKLKALHTYDKVWVKIEDINLLIKELEKPARTLNDVKGGMKL